MSTDRSDSDLTTPGAGATEDAAVDPNPSETERARRDHERRGEAPRAADPGLGQADIGQGDLT